MDKSGGVMLQLADGTLYHKPYVQLLEETVNSNDPAIAPCA